MAFECKLNLKLNLSIEYLNCVINDYIERLSEIKKLVLCKLYNMLSDYQLESNDISNAEINLKKCQELLNEIKQQNIGEQEEEFQSKMLKNNENYNEEYLKETAYVDGKLGKCYFYKCDYQTSFTYLKQAEKLLFEKNLTGNAVDAFIKINLGNYYRFMFQDDLSEKYIEESLKLRYDIFGEISDEYADSLHAKAHLYMDMGKNEQSEQIATKVYEIRKQIYNGENNTKVTRSLYLLGNIYLRGAKLQKAEEVCQKALKINLEIVGENFIETAEIYHILGRIYSQLKHKNIDFQFYFDKAIKIFKQIYGPVHAFIAIVLNHYGTSFYEIDKYYEAENCFEEAINIYKKLCGSNHMNLAITLRKSGDCNKKLNIYKSAKENYEEALKIYENQYGKDDSIVKELQNFIDELSNLTD